MAFSAPVFYLKRKARLLARKQQIPLHDALDRVAASEGFASWSLLAANAPVGPCDNGLLDQISPGDLILLGARPRQGKTLMGLRLLLAAMRAGRSSAFFSLEYTESDIEDRFRALGEKRAKFAGLFEFHDSDAINADYIRRALAEAPAGSLAVVDYLQLLDQRRDNPNLDDQVRDLRLFARERGIVLVFITQIDRAFEQSGKTLPDLADVRLPNPLDLGLFDKACFLNRGEIHFGAVN